MLLLFVSALVLGAAFIAKRWVRILAAGVLLFILWQLLEDPSLMGRELIDKRRRAEAPLADYRAGVTDLVKGLQGNHNRNVMFVGAGMAILIIFPCFPAKIRRSSESEGDKLT